MTGELAPLYRPDDRCHRCSTPFAEHGPESRFLPPHLFTPKPAGQLREYVLADQGRRYLAFDALYWSRS